MGVLFIDGFDKYGPPGLFTQVQSNGFTNSGTALAAVLQANEWSALTLGSNSTNFAFAQTVAGLSSTGYALQLQGGGGSGVGNFTLSRTLPGNYATLIGGMRVRADFLGLAGVQFQDASNAQCGWRINATSGTISVVSGVITTGTVLATSSASFATGSTHYVEWQFTFGTSAAYQIWLDGVSIISGTGNTRAGSTNNYANVLALTGANVTTGSAISGGITVDDLYTFDTSGSVNNAPLLTNPRIETQYPSGDFQTQFTNGASILGQAYSASSNTNTPGPNILFLRRFAPATSCTINSVSTVPMANNGNANFRPAIYSDSAGSPGSLLSTGAAVTGTSTGVTLTAALTTPQSLTAGTNYWIGFITDTSVALQLVDGSLTGYKVSATYGSGAPASPSGFTTGQGNWLIWGNCTGSATNWSSQTDNPALSGLTYAYASTVGNADLYSFPALSATPANIYTVAIKSYGAKTDTGTRTLNLSMKSATTSSSGSNAGIVPAPGFGWMTSFFDTDPNTGVAWTGAGLNAAYSGSAVAS